MGRGGEATTAGQTARGYKFAGLPKWDDTIVPSPKGFTFPPVAQTAKVSRANVTGVNFRTRPRRSTNGCTDAAREPHGTAGRRNLHGGGRGDGYAHYQWTEERSECKRCDAASYHDGVFFFLSSRFFGFCSRDAKRRGQGTTSARGGTNTRRTLTSAADDGDCDAATVDSNLITSSRRTPTVTPRGQTATVRSSDGKFTVELPVEQERRGNPRSDFFQTTQLPATA